MKRIAILLSCIMGLVMLGPTSNADGPHSYGGQQPWWNIFARRPKLNPEEERLQRFWHDYYSSMGLYYRALDHIDWVAYYKNHGYQINTGGGAGCYPGCGVCGGPNRIQFAPVFVSPNMQWAVPNSSVNGPPSGPGGPPPGVFPSGGISYGPPSGGGPPPNGGGGPPPGYNPGPPPGYGGPPPGYGGPPPGYGGPPPGPGYGGPPPGYGGPPPGYGGPPPGYGGPPPGYGGPPPGYGGPPPGYGPPPSGYGAGPGGPGGPVGFNGAYLSPYAAGPYTTGLYMPTSYVPPAYDTYTADGSSDALAMR